MDPQHRMLLECTGELLAPGVLHGSSASAIQLKGTSGVLGVRLNQHFFLKNEHRQESLSNLALISMKHCIKPLI